MKCKIMHRCRGGDGKFSTRNIFSSNLRLSLLNIEFLCKTIFQFNFRILINQLSNIIFFLESIYVEISIPSLN